MRHSKFSERLFCLMKSVRVFQFLWSLPLFPIMGIATVRFVS